jgi:hypothetical protein
MLLDNLVAAFKLLPKQGSSIDALQKPTAVHDAKPESLDNEQDSHGRLDALVLSNLKSGMKIGILLALVSWRIFVTSLLSLWKSRPTIK